MTMWLPVLALGCCMAVSRADIFISYSVAEEAGSGYLLGSLREDSGVVNDFSAAMLAQVRFGLLPGPHTAALRVDSVSGLLYVEQRLDRDGMDGCHTDVCKLNVEAAILAPEFTVIRLDISLHDINDNAPTFSKAQFSVTVSESSAQGTRLMLPTATDPDSGVNSIKEYTLLSPHPVFSLDWTLPVADTGAGSGLYLVLQGRLDHETQTTYTLQVIARDGGSPSRSGTLDVDIVVVDANDNTPVFDQPQYNISVQENHELYQSIVMVHATDRDHGLNGKILYKFSQQTYDQYHNTFGLNNSTGAVYLKQALDYRQRSKHSLVVIAQDHGVTSQQAHATVTINVLDVNNHVPEITVTGVVHGQEVGVDENSPEGAIVAVVTVQDRDPGENGRCSCYILDDNFSLLEIYTNGYKIVSERVFDREMQDTYLSVVQCTDHGAPALTSQTEVLISVYDVNDHAPSFQFTNYQVNVQENTTAGAALIRVQASDADRPGSDNARITYSLEQSAMAHLIIDSDTGVITLVSPVDYELASVLQYRILAQDNGVPAKTAQAVLRLDVVDVNDEAPVFIQTSYNFGTYENQSNVTEIGTVTAEDRDSAPYNTFAYSLLGDDEVLQKFTIDAANGRISTRSSLDREIKAMYSMVVMVTDIYPPQHSSSVTVTIYVADKNDNVPEIIFPTAHNSSVEVSVYAPEDYLFTRVVAIDKDLGTNAKLTYDIMNDYDIFTIDPDLGNIYVRSSLQDIVDSVLELRVVVSDNGSPSLVTSANLQVVVNRTLLFAQELNILPQSGELLTNHEMILVVLGVVTILIVSILVAAIVVVKRRQIRNSKDATRYQQRADFSKKLGSNSTLAPPGGAAMAEAGGSSASLWVNKPPQGGDTSEHCPSYADVLHSSHKSLPMSSASQASYFAGKGISSKDSPPRVNTAPRLSSFTVKYPLRVADHDSDTASRCSAELSNTDSGHGPSEEGDADSHQMAGPGGRCPVHGSTDAGHGKLGRTGSEASANLPHLGGSKQRPPSLRSHEHGLGTSQSLPGVHGHQRGQPITHKMNNLSAKPPQRPPKHPLTSYKPPPSNLWINSNKYNINTGTGSGQRSHPEPALWVAGPALEESDNEDANSSSASEGSFVLNIDGEVKSVNV